MKIRNIGRKKEYDVYAIAVYTQKDWELKDRVVFYTAEDDLFGLGVEGLTNVEIIDQNLDKDFVFHTMDDKSGFVILWSHFSDINHLARLIDQDPQTISAFEQARAMHSSRKRR